MTRVLAVDDDPQILHLLRLTLTLDGFDVDTASDGDEALLRLAECTPDVVLLDVMMPVRDGWDVCAAIKADATLCHVPVVFLSARCQAADVERGRALGASAFLTKPFDPSELAEILSGVIAVG